MQWFSRTKIGVSNMHVMIASGERGGHLRFRKTTKLKIDKQTPMDMVHAKFENDWCSGFREIDV